MLLILKSTFDSMGPIPCSPLTIVKPCLIGRFQGRKDHDHVFISPGSCVKGCIYLIKSELLMCLLTFQFSVVDTDKSLRNMWKYKEIWKENVVLQRNIKDVLLWSILPSLKAENAVKCGNSFLSNSSFLVLQVAQTLFMWKVVINRFVTEVLSPNIVTFYPDLKKTVKGWAAYFWNKVIKLWCIRCRCRELFCSRSFIDSTVPFLIDIWYKNAIVFFIYKINPTLQIKTANHISSNFLLMSCSMICFGFPLNWNTVIPFGQSASWEFVSQNQNIFIQINNICKNELQR